MSLDALDKHASKTKKFTPVTEIGKGKKKPLHLFVIIYRLSLPYLMARPMWEKRLGAIAIFVFIWIFGYGTWKSIELIIDNFK